MNSPVRVLLMAAGLSTVSLQAQTFNIIYSFTTFGQGDAPVGVPYIGTGGVIYGSANGGGTPCITSSLGCGNEFSLLPPAQLGGAWTEKVLHDFRSTPDGAYPESSLIGGPNGTLYGTTAYGGNDVHCGSGCGTLIQLTPPAQPSGRWTEQVLYDFHHFDQPSHTLLADGNLGMSGRRSVLTCVLEAVE